MGIYIVNMMGCPINMKQDASFNNVLYYMDEKFSHEANYLSMMELLLSTKIYTSI